MTERIALAGAADLDALAARPWGRILGLTGAPGSGKSTLALALARRTSAVVVPMDGFHLADVTLDALGLRARKGAPETFDPAGYAAILGRIRSGTKTVYVPAFERTLEQPVAGAIAVPGGVRVVTEGNYLLLDADPWPAARASCDQVWHTQVAPDLRRARLVARHVAFGKSAAEASAWVDRVDEPNARLVEAAAFRADLIVDLTDWSVA